MEASKEMARHVRAVVKALEILDCFQSEPILTLPELVKRTGMTRSGVMRLLGTLESRGYVVYDLERRSFQLGPRLMTLGKVFETNQSLISLARPLLKGLVQKTGESASLYVRDGLERVALAREKASHEISYLIREGERMQLYAGAAGKVLLAFAPSDVQEKVLNRRFLKKLTCRTITDAARLRKELEAIRRKGYAVSEGERVDDVWSVAAPVFDHRGVVCASIGMTGPLYRIPRRLQILAMRAVLEKAQSLSRRLGWQRS